MSTSPQRPAKTLRSLRRCLGYLALALLVTWPMPLHPVSTIIGHPEASVGCHVWVLWWARFHLGEIVTPLIFHPYGADVMRLYGSDVLSPLIMGSLPLPPTLLYNLWVVFLLVLGGLGLDALARDQGATWGGAAVGGTIMVTAPFFQHEIFNGTSEILAGSFLPWFTLMLLRLLREPNRARGLATGAIAAISVLASAYNLFFLLVVTLCVLTWRAVSATEAIVDRDTWKWGGLGVGLAGLLAAPLAVLHKVHGAEALYARGVEWIDPAASFPDSFADLLAWVDLREAIIPIVQSSPDGGSFEYWTTCTVYLGLVALGLALLGLRTRPGPFGLILGVGMLIAMGPYLRVGGQPVVVGGGLVHLPAQIIARAFPPFVITAIHAYRYATVVVMALAVLASMAARRPWWVLPILADAILLSPMPWPAAVAEVRDSEVLRGLATMPEGAVFMTPFEKENLGDLSRMLLAQTVHGHPIHDGAIHRRAGESATRLFSENPLVGDLSGRGGHKLPSPRASAFGIQDLHEKGFRYTLVPTDAPDVGKWMETMLGAPLASDTEWVLWALPAPDPTIE